MTNADRASAPEERSLPVWAVAAAFVALVFALHASSFFHSIENWDESIYLLVARDWLDGRPLYGGIWDHKPPGIYLLFALAQLVFGRTVLSIRILACLAVAASCVALFLLGRALRDERTGLVAGFLYAVFSLGSGGLAANTEIFLAPFVACAFWLFFARARGDPRRDSRLALLLGLCAGVALQIKYTVAFDFAALCVWVALTRPFELVPLLRFLALAAIGPLCGFGIAIGCFFASGHLDDYLYANVAANLNYSASAHFDPAQLAWMTYRRVREAFPLWFCALLAPFYVIFFRTLGREPRARLAALLLWEAFAFLGMCSTGRLFAHYFLQPLLPLCVVAALVLLVTIEMDGRSSRLRTGLLLVLILLGPVMTTVQRPFSHAAKAVYYRYVRGVEHWGDEAAQVAAYLRPRIHEGDVIYVADYQPIVYYLLPVELPTRFPFPTHLTDAAWKGVAPVDQEAEVRRILEKRPLYVVKQKERPTRFYEILHETLDRSYQLEKTIGRVSLYRLRDR